MHQYVTVLEIVNMSQFDSF